MSPYLCSCAKERMNLPIILLLTQHPRGKSGSKRSSSQSSVVVQRCRRKKTAIPCSNACGHTSNWEEFNLPVPEEKTSRKPTVEPEAPGPCAETTKGDLPGRDPEPTLDSQRTQEDSKGRLWGNVSVGSNCDTRNGAIRSSLVGTSIH